MVSDRWFMIVDLPLFALPKMLIKFEAESMSAGAVFTDTVPPPVGCSHFTEVSAGRSPPGGIMTVMVGYLSEGV